MTIAANAFDIKSASLDLLALLLRTDNLDELKQAGLELSDDQYLAIYAFALKGAEGLSRFRTAVRGKPFVDGGNVSSDAVETGRD